MGTPKVRENPRFSLNALADYLTAPAARRRKIVEEQKRPRPFQVSYYVDAEMPILEVLETLDLDLTPVRHSINHLSQAPWVKEWDRTRHETCVEALRAFQELALDLPFAELSRQRLTGRQRHFNIAGVELSVRPEILLRKEAGDGEIGAAKLYFSKNEPLTEERAKYAGAVLCQYLQHAFAREGRCSYRACYVVDVFARRVFQAPRTYQRRLQDVKAACAEIALLWPLV